MTILFTFIGESDMSAAGLGSRPAAADDPGPIGRCLDSTLEPWRSVVLIDDRSEPTRAQRYLVWLRARHPNPALYVHRMSIANPADFELVLGATRSAVETFSSDAASERAYLSTAMAMCWMYLALQPATRGRLLIVNRGQPAIWLPAGLATPRKQCLILRGIPGSGKSTLARSLALEVGLEPASCIFSTDDRFDESNGGVFDPVLLPRMHQMNLALFIRALGRGTPLVICDNTNVEDWEFAPYVAAAEALGYEVWQRLVGDPGNEAFVRECAARNTRGVPEERVREMARLLDAGRIRGDRPAEAR